MVLLALVASFAAGCAVSHKTVVKPGEGPGPLQSATRDDLVARYNQQAQAITSLNATVSMKLTAGSAYSGVIENYHEVNGFILASRPASIRVIGQAPVVGKNVFDMVSDGKTFEVFIPSKHKFLVGDANLVRPAKKPIENLRPQHLVDALLLTPIPEKGTMLFEEAIEPAGRYYVLTLVNRRITDTSFGIHFYADEWEIARKIWFERSNLNVARLETYSAGGKLESDVHYSSWELADGIIHPDQISISRPGDDYQLDITIKKLTVNESISPARFILKQPEGTELVRVSEENSDANPEAPKFLEPKPPEPKQ